MYIYIHAYKHTRKSQMYNSLTWVHLYILVVTWLDVLHVLVGTLPYILYDIFNYSLIVFGYFHF